MDFVDTMTLIIAMSLHARLNDAEQCIFLYLDGPTYAVERRQ